MRRRTTDPRIERLRASCLGLGLEDASWLAAVADEVDVRAGTVLGHHRFTHVVLTGEQAGLVVGAGEPAVTLEHDGAVLALTSRDVDELARRLSATAAATTTVAFPAPQPVL
jgi:hypothetical protein